MIRLLLLHCLLLVSIASIAETIIVKNIDELHAADKNAKPGDIIILQNGEWNDVAIVLTSNGTKDQPILFKAQTAGEVWITGHSSLKIGGSFITVEGFRFAEGYAGDDAVISFRSSKDKLANSCRVTNCVINDFNNPKRMDENNWVLFYGKNNRLDRCSFVNKKNMGVLLAVILDDDRSRENFHSIDHNYFGKRPPLASNGGEIIRVGVSQHCQFNSNTQITDNYFEHCDGETEIISIKSCTNVVRGNLFKESQGSVVLRHGDHNIVENNIFFGNDKEATGGIRVINKGQWIVNNFFYKCRGTGFRSPLAIMNGIPNSPAHRYVQVTDAVIANNTFLDCAPLSFGEGSDAERTLPPDHVFLLNNILSNSRDSFIYKAYDKTDGINFSGNEVNKEAKQTLPAGFIKISFTTQKNNIAPLPLTTSKIVSVVSDSLQQAAQAKLNHPLSGKAGFSDLLLIRKIQANAYNGCGARWFEEEKSSNIKTKIECKTAEELANALSKKSCDNLLIDLTGSIYRISAPFQINVNTEIISSTKKTIRFESNVGTAPGYALFEIKGSSSLWLNNIDIDFGGLKDYRNIVVSDTSGSSQHISFTVTNCSFKNIGCYEGAFFLGSKSMLCDSVSVTNTTFNNNCINILKFDMENDKKGYYNVEKLVFSGNKISHHAGTVLEMLRGGNDESTLGPKLIFVRNTISNAKPGQLDRNAMIYLNGTQQSTIQGNTFTNCFYKNLIMYEDTVRAVHLLRNNRITKSGAITSNQYVTSQNNTVN